MYHCNYLRLLGIQRTMDTQLVFVVSDDLKWLVPNGRMSSPPPCSPCLRGVFLGDGRVIAVWYRATIAGHKGYQWSI